MKLAKVLLLSYSTILINSTTSKNLKQSIRKTNLKTFNKDRKLSDIFSVDVDGATTATIDRYYKEPPLRDVPFNSSQGPSGTGYSSNTDCVLNGAGVFGTSGTNDMVPLLFEYELELTSQDDLEGKTIPDLEQAIGMDLARDVNVCTVRRRVQDEEKNVVVVGTMSGVGLLPVDQVNTNKTCATSNEESTSCVFVNGIMTLYYIPATSDGIIRNGNEIEQSSLTIIESNMNSGKYNSGAVNPNIVRVTYTAPTTSTEEEPLPISNVEETPTGGITPSPPVQRGSDSQKAYGYVIIASCAVLAVVAIIFVRRKSMLHANNSSSASSGSNELQSIEKDDNIINDQTTITTSITKDVPSDLEISVTDTTDVSTMGSPSSSNDDSSISTLGVSMGCPSNESMDMEHNQEVTPCKNDYKDNSTSTITASKRNVPAPLLGGYQDEDEKSYQDDEFLFNT